MANSEEGLAVVLARMDPDNIVDTSHTLAKALTMEGLSSFSCLPLKEHCPFSNKEGTEGERKKEKQGCPAGHLVGSMYCSYSWTRLFTRRDQLPLFYTSEYILKQTTPCLIVRTPRAGPEHQL